MLAVVVFPFSWQHQCTCAPSTILHPQSREGCPVVSTGRPYRPQVCSNSAQKLPRLAPAPKCGPRGGRWPKAQQRDQKRAQCIQNLKSGPRTSSGEPKGCQSDPREEAEERQRAAEGIPRGVQKRKKLLREATRRSQAISESRQEVSKGTLGLQSENLTAKGEQLMTFVPSLLGVNFRVQARVGNRVLQTHAPSHKS